jgi:hypothetical protein
MLERGQKLLSCRYYRGYLRAVNESIDVPGYG